MAPSSEVIDTLLEKACPSIRYRAHLELLGETPAGAGMAGLQDAILQDERVREVIGWRQADGWLGEDFHGSKSLEAGVRLLCEKGVRRDHPVIVDALDALEAHPERLTRGLGKVGAMLDALKLGGAQMIRAAVFAYAGAEERPGVQAQVEVALEGLRAVLGVSAVEEIIEIHKGKPIFRPGVVWPGIYHLRLLAFTQRWRTPDRLAMLAQAFERLAELSPLPQANARCQSQVIAPASFCMQDFNPSLESLDAAGWMMWFHRMELLARLGMADRVAALRAQAERLSEILDAGNGWFSARLNHDYFKDWGAYTGLMLEPDWRSAERRAYDLTFRSLLILYYSSEARSSG